MRRRQNTQKEKISPKVSKDLKKSPLDSENITSQSIAPEESKAKNIENSDENALEIYDHTKCWEANVEYFSRVSEFDAEIQSAYDAISLWPVFLFAMMEFHLLDYLGTDTAIDLLISFSNKFSPLGSAGVPLIFSLLLIIKTLFLEAFKEKSSDRVYEKTIKPKYQNVLLDLSVLYKMKVESASEETINERALIYDKNVRVLRIPLLSSKIWLGALAGLFLSYCTSNRERAGASLLLNSILPLLKNFYRSFGKKSLDIRQDLEILRLFFKNEKIKQIHQAIYSCGGKNKVLNLFFMKYSRKALNENALIKFMRTNSAIVIIARTTKGLIFKIGDAAALNKLDVSSLDLSLPKVIRKIEVPNLPREDRQRDLVLQTPAQTRQSPEIESTAVAPKSGKRKELGRAGMRVQLDTIYQKRGTPPKPAEEKKSHSVSNYPAWLVTYEKACEEIIKVNSSEEASPIRLFTYGSAIRDIREKPGIMKASDIDLCIIILNTQQFKFPATLIPLAPFRNEYNNVACQYEGLCIDITVNYVSILNPEIILSPLLGQIDFSHLREVLPHNKNIACSVSEHTQTCIEQGILSANPRKARNIFEETPYRIFRALSAIFSGYFRVDEDMYMALNDVEFCLDSSKRQNPLKNSQGINKLLGKAHPALVFAQLQKFGWLKQYFPEASTTYTLTLARAHYVYTRLQNTELKKDVAPFYALLLWPSFTQNKFYLSDSHHFIRAQNFFISKAQDGILFPSNSSDSLQFRISLLLYWLSKDIKKFEEGSVETESSQFAHTLIMQYTPCRLVLKSAFSNRLEQVDLPALLNESIYRHSKPAPLGEEVLHTVGPVYDYFSGAKL